MNTEKLIRELIHDEGLRLKPYTDSVGKTTIGVGRNLTDVGISEGEAKSMLLTDIHNARRECATRFRFWLDLTENRQRALCNMVFNMGMPRVMRFKKMLAALEERDYSQAAEEALDSKWARQVGDRATRVAVLLRG